MIQPLDAPRARNAAATRAAILDAARARFARESYENVGVREIAADAGVDAALVSRYFGGKEELFAEVLLSGKRPTELFEGEIAGFGERVARYMLDNPPDSDKLNMMMIMLRSASSPVASELVRRSGRECMLDPFVKWLGGEDAETRVQVCCSVMLGMALTRALNGDAAPSAQDKDKLRKRLAAVLQRCVEPDAV